MFSLQETRSSYKALPKNIDEQGDTNQANNVINTKLYIATFSVQNIKNNKWYVDSKTT